MANQVPSAPYFITNSGKKRIGISTCGGDCPGLNPVIRGIVLTAIKRYGWEVIGIEDSTRGLIDLNYQGPNGNQFLTIEAVDNLIARGGTILGSSNRSHPFAYAAEMEDGTIVETDISATVVENFHKLGLDALVMVGGDGSMNIAHRLGQLGLPIVGVPKTIDNDLDSTDLTFGFNTAVQTIVEAVDRIKDTAASHDRVMIVEVMGRGAGWLALHSGVASGAEIIIIPEIPYNPVSIIKKIKEAHDHKNFSSIIVISEGAKPKGGSESYVGERKPGEMLRLKGAAARLEHELTEINKKGQPWFLKELEIRSSVLGYIQRGGSPSNFDRILGTRLGIKAVELIAAGDFGKMASVRNGEIDSVSIESASTKPRHVSPDDRLIADARLIGVCFGDNE